MTNYTVTITRANGTKQTKVFETVYENTTETYARNAARDYFGIDIVDMKIEGEKPEAEVLKTGEKVINEFFEKWEKETVEWYAKAYDLWINDYKEFQRTYRPTMGKTAYIQMINNNLELMKEIIKKNMAEKKASLMYKISGKVGEITELDLCNGTDGTPNGTVTGTTGKVKIETIIAGGYNIQCTHYRVLVKAAK